LGSRRDHLRKTKETTTDAEFRQKSLKEQEKDGGSTSFLVLFFSDFLLKV
jgi:hypothetical protein